jgi:DNA polymerase-3 subunit epsilon
VAARPTPPGGWEIVCVRFGRLAGTTVVPFGGDARLYVEALTASAEIVAPSPGPAASASAEETEKILRWLDSPDVRLVAIDGEWTCPVHGAGAARDTLDADPTTYSDLVSFDEPSSPGLRRRPPAVVLKVPTAPTLPTTLVVPRAPRTRVDT